MPKRSQGLERCAAAKAAPLEKLAFQYQPVVDVAAALGGDQGVFGFEALVRRTRPDGTIAGPQAILPIVLRPPWRDRFTRFTLEWAGETLAERPSVARLNVNLSPLQLVSRAAVDAARELRPEIRARLTVEVTEEPFVDLAAARGAIAAMRDLGIAVWLDDMSPGRFEGRAGVVGEVDGIKVDRSVVVALLKGSATAAAFVRMLSTRSEVLVAEGIEAREVVPGLARHGFTHFQGFGLGEPWSEPRVDRRIAGANDAAAVRVLRGRGEIGG